jgi:hypothetical protein
MGGSIKILLSQNKTSLSWSLRSPSNNIVFDTTFYKLRGDGKDFEHVWVLLLQTHLLLQHRVRVGADRRLFWPLPIGDRSDVAPPSGVVLNVFADLGDARETALFAAVAENRVYEATGSTINRSFKLGMAEPRVMLWHDLWTVTVRGSSKADCEPRWNSSTRDVVWRSPALVYFSQPTHEAVDFMLLVGAAGGSGATAPHVYMFQCKARRDNITPLKLQAIVDNLDGELDKLFSASFAMHVLRRAGVESKKQVTLCVAALHVSTFEYGEKKGIKANLSRPPEFNVVLFDAQALVDLGGAAFKTTRFMRSLIEKRRRQLRG